MVERKRRNVSMNHRQTIELYRGYYPQNYPSSAPSPYSAIPFNPYYMYAIQQITPNFNRYNLNKRQTTSSAAGAAGSGILTGIANTKSAVETATNIIKQLNQFRSVVLEINNHTNLTFRKRYEKLEEGGWALTPTGQIPPQQTLVFGAQSPSWTITEGTVGHIIYTAPGVDTEFGVTMNVKWSNPVWGENTCDLTIHGPDAHKYWINKECSKVDVGANMRFEIYPR